MGQLRIKVQKKQPLTEHERARLHILFKKSKKTIGSYLSLVDFKQPVLFLIRGNKVEFYEDVRTDTWQVPDDDKGRIIHLKTLPLDFEYGNKSFKGYICNIDEAFPLPQRPLVYSELMELIIRKIITNYKNLETPMGKITTLMWTVFGMLALGAVIYVFFIQGNIQAATPAAQAVNETVKNVTQNLTRTIIG